MSWRLSHYSCRGAESAGPLALLPGWAMPHTAWGVMIDALRQHFSVIALDWPAGGPESLSTDALLEGLAASLPERCNLLGWSLGGMLAVRYAQRHPQRVGGLATIASNACFVATEGWPQAMHPVQFHAFSQDVRRAPETALRRFTGFQAKGDENERELLRQLREAQAAQPLPPVASLSAGLELLGGLDNREAIRALAIPQLHVLGERDNLVPVACAAGLAGLNAAARLEVVAGAAHAPFLSDPDALLEWLRQTLPPLPDAPLVAGADPYALDKRDIADSFSRAAASYDSVADLQRQVGDALLALLPPELKPARSLDLGSGTGYFSARLASRFGGQTLALDIAPGMLKFARHKRPMPNLQWVCGDAERLPLATASQSLVFSSLALQWCDDLERALKEVSRVLAPGGVFALATLLPGTLKELEQAWRGVDERVHVNRFLPLEDVERAVSASGLKPLQVEQRRWAMHYRDTPALLHSLKALGAHNVNAGRPRGLAGRSTLAALGQCYERFRVQQGLPATYQVYLAVFQR